MERRLLGQLRVLVMGPQKPKRGDSYKDSKQFYVYRTPQYTVQMETATV
jgi:hypothetical protein